MKINSKFTRIVGVGLSVAMLASTVLSAVPAFADVSAVTASTNNSGISQNGTWDIRFTATNAISGNGTVGGNITLTWPTGFTVNNSAANVTSITVAGGPGWLSNTNFGNPVLNILTINSTAATRQVFIGLNGTDVIGAGAQVRIVLPVGVVTNPSTAGSYTMTVATSNDTTAIASNAVVVTLPNIGPLPGQVEGKNSNGDVLYRNIVSDLSTVIATPGVSTIELAAGTYNATLGNTASISGQTIKGVGAAGSVIMTAPIGQTALTVTAVNVTIDNIVFQGNVAGVDNLLAVGANNTVVKNSTFNGGVNQVVVAFTASNNRTTISDSILNVTGNVTAGVVTSDSLTTNATYNVDNGGTAIVASNGGLSVTAGAKFNGTSGTGAGILLQSTTAWRSSTIASATFTGLGNNALIAGGTNSSASVQVSTSTFTGCGNSTATSSTTDGVITANGTTDLILINNTISNSAAAAYGVYVSGGNVSARFNSITNTSSTAKTVKRTSGTADFINNWWGSASGPLSDSLSGTVTTTPFLTGVTNSPSVVFVGSNVSGGTAGGLPSGIDLSCANATTGASLNASVLSVAKYASNPQTTAPAGAPIAYYDVYVSGLTTESGSTITIKFYVAGLTSNSLVYYGGGLNGAWTLASNQGVNVPGGFVFVTVTSASAPSINDMDGTPFVVTNVVPPPAAPVLNDPAGAAAATVFSWNAVAGATTYNFQVSTTSAFTTTVSSQTGLTTNAFGPVVLAANTSYFWRVQAVNSQGSSDWVVGTYATAAPTTGGGTGTVTLPPITNNVTVPAPVVNVAPPNVTVNPPNVTVNPPTVNVAAPPAPAVTVNPPQVTVQPPPPANVQVNVPETQQLIPSYILWTIILIGAVLVIALIVLIVRTRRVA